MNKIINTKLALKTLNSFKPSSDYEYKNYNTKNNNCCIIL
jgi:hypothetical protein